MTVDGLTVESSAERLTDDKNQTNNIINAIMPFDTENAVKFDSNYMHGFTSEKRDTNVSDLEPLVDKQIQDIARNSAINIDPKYDRGYRFSKEEVSVEGKQWRAAYLPVWLYSYYQQDNGLLHYVAVNARTKETHGSVPLNKPKLFIVSAIIEAICVFFSFMFLFANYASEDDGSSLYLTLLLGGFIFYGAMYLRYRNQNARHTFELETKRQLDNIVKDDTFVKVEKKLKNKRIQGENGQHTDGNVFGEKATSFVGVAKTVNSITDKF